MNEYEDVNRQKHGDPGPFLVCEKTTSPQGEVSGGWVSACFKCGVHVLVPRNLMVTWRNTGAIVVCASCSGGKAGQLLGTF